MIWLLLGLLALGGELLLPGAFLLWAGLAALGTGLAALLLGTGFVAEAALFLLLLGAGVAASLRWRRRGPANGLNTPDSGLVGRDGTVLPGLELRVRVGDSDWPARLVGREGDEAPAAGARVRVAAVDGLVLEVRRD